MLSSGEIIFPKNFFPPPTIPKPPTTPPPPSQQATQHQQEEKQKLEDLVEQSKKVLLKISSVFPFDLFPDIVTIDENRVSIITKELFETEQVLSIPIKSISNVVINTIPFFASLILYIGRQRSSNGSEEGEAGGEQSKIRVVTINFLKQAEAIKARRIIQGLMMATEQKIDFGKIEVGDLIKQLEKLGSIAGEEITNE